MTMQNRLTRSGRTLPIMAGSTIPVLRYANDGDKVFTGKPDNNDIHDWPWNVPAS